MLGRLREGFCFNPATHGTAVPLRLHSVPSVLDGSNRLGYGLQSQGMHSLHCFHYGHPDLRCRGHVGAVQCNHHHFSNSTDSIPDVSSPPHTHNHTSFYRILIIFSQNKLPGMKAKSKQYNQEHKRETQPPFLGRQPWTARYHCTAAGGASLPTSWPE